jgi:hypothetical protein
LFSFLPFLPPRSSLALGRSASFFIFRTTFRLGTNFFLLSAAGGAAPAAVGGAAPGRADVRPTGLAPRVRSRLTCDERILLNAQFQYLSTLTTS